MKTNCLLGSHPSAEALFPTCADSMGNRQQSTSANAHLTYHASAFGDFVQHSMGHLGLHWRSVAGFPSNGSVVPTACFMFE